MKNFFMIYKLLNIFFIYLKKNKDIIKIIIIEKYILFDNLK